MSDVTLSRKRYCRRGRAASQYVFVCLACDLLAMSERADAITCSPACRVRLHRHPDRRVSVFEAARHLQVHPSSVLQSEAVLRLMPDLANDLRDGKLTIDDAQRQVWPKYWALVKAQAEGSVL